MQRTAGIDEASQARKSFSLAWLQLEHAAQGGLQAMGWTSLGGHPKATLNGTPTEHTEFDVLLRRNNTAIIYPHMGVYIHLKGP